MVLLTLYEFEAKAQLGDSDLSLCLDTAEALPHADPGTFETLAGKQYVHCNYLYLWRTRANPDPTPLSRQTLHPVMCTDVRPCSLPLQIVSNFLVINTALAVEPPAYYREISMRALRVAIKKHLAMDVVDFTKLR